MRLKVLNSIAPTLRLLVVFITNGAEAFASSARVWPRDMSNSPRVLLDPDIAEAFPTGAEVKGRRAPRKAT